MAEDPKPVARTSKSGVVIPHKAKWHQRLVAALIYGVIRVMAATIRFKLDDQSGLFTKPTNEKIIFAIWHNRLSLALILYHRYVGRVVAGRRLAALVSASRDGGMLARILEHFSVEPVRGSSSRRGARALLEMVSWGERGYDLAITPDGPRGPRYNIQEGVIATAQLTGLAIVPVSYHLNWKWQLKSWDRFQIPLPFACCRITTAPAVRVAKEASDEEREELRKQLEATMRAITKD